MKKIILEEYGDILTVEDIMEILHVGRNTAYKLVNMNVIPSFKVGKRYLIPKKNLYVYLHAVTHVCYDDSVNEVAICG